MATQAQFQEVLTRIDAATNDIAEDLRRLAEQISNGGITGEAEDAIVAQLEASASALEAVAAQNVPPAQPEA